MRGLGRDWGKKGPIGRQYQEGGTGSFEHQPASAIPGLLSVVGPWRGCKVVMPQRSKGVPLEATKSCLLNERFKKEVAFAPARASEADARAGLAGVREGGL